MLSGFYRWANIPYLFSNFRWKCFKFNYTNFKCQNICNTFIRDGNWETLLIILKYFFYNCVTEIYNKKGPVPGHFIPLAYLLKLSRVKRAKESGIFIHLNSNKGPSRLIFRMAQDERVAQKIIGHTPEWKVLRPLWRRKINHFINCSEPKYHRQWRILRQ